MRISFKTTSADFKCLYCHNPVSFASMVSGVNNRNHCPYCLWSRHLDLYKAGDRLSACKEAMRPVGLTLKKTAKKYSRPGQGELMIIHVCTSCGQVSINRIAADDDSQMILEVFEASWKLDAGSQDDLERAGIHLLRAHDLALVRRQLFGWSGAPLRHGPRFEPAQG